MAFSLQNEKQQCWKQQWWLSGQSTGPEIVICNNFLTHKTLRNYYQLFYIFLCVQIKLEFGSVGFWGEGKTDIPGEGPFRVLKRTWTTYSSSHMLMLGFQPEPHRNVSVHIRKYRPVCTTETWENFFFLNRKYYYHEIEITDKFFALYWFLCASVSFILLIFFYYHTRDG